MTDADHFYLDRQARKHLREKLATIPRIAKDIAITECRQAVTVRPGLSNPRRPKKMESRLPFHIGAADAAHELRNSLATAVRHTCEQRGLDYWPVGYTHAHNFIGPLQPEDRRLPPGYDEGAPMVTAKWLWKNVIALALTEGCREFADDIVSAIDYCEREIQGPVDEVVIDEARVKAANKSVVTTSTIDSVAKRLGERGKGLTAERIRTLVKHHGLKSAGVDKDTGTKFYRLGDLLAVHEQVKTRGRQKVS